MPEISVGPAGRGCVRRRRLTASSSSPAPDCATGGEGRRRQLLLVVGRSWRPGPEPQHTARVGRLDHAALRSLHARHAEAPAKALSLVTVQRARVPVRAVGVGLHGRVSPSCMATGPLSTKTRLGLADREGVVVAKCETSNAPAAACLTKQTVAVGTTTDATP